MKDYAKPCPQENKPDHVMLHVGTNDLASENNANRIGKSIVDLTKSSVNDYYSINISSIIPRNDNTKAEDAIFFLWGICSNDGVNLTENSRSINPKKHLSNSKLHLNLKGSAKLQCIFIDLIKNKFPI